MESIKKNNGQLSSRRNKNGTFDFKFNYVQLIAYLRLIVIRWCLKFLSTSIDEFDNLSGVGIS